MPDHCEIIKDRLFSSFSLNDGKSKFNRVRHYFWQEQNAAANYKTNEIQRDDLDFESNLTHVHHIKYLSDQFLFSGYANILNINLNNFVQSLHSNILILGVHYQIGPYIPQYFKQFEYNFPGLLIFNASSSKVVQPSKKINNFNPYYYRIPRSNLYKRKRFKINLDEITPVEEENEIPSNENNLLLKEPVATSSKYTYENLETNKRFSNHNEEDIFILDPTLLEAVPRKRSYSRKLAETEHKQIVRITILYILAFFALTLTTFFIIYLA